MNSFQLDKPYVFRNQSIILINQIRDISTAFSLH
jgi:hypothetical protein